MLNWLIACKACKLTLLQSLHSSGVPLQRPPNDDEKQDPDVAPDLGGPMYNTEQPPPDWQSYEHNSFSDSGILKSCGFAENNRVWNIIKV